MQSIGQHQNAAHRAAWENKTNKLVEDNLVRTKLNDLKRRRASDLEGRKAKLS